MELNNGEIIAAILTAGVFGRLDIKGQIGPLNPKIASAAVVDCYDEVLVKLKETHGEIFLPTHLKSNDTPAEFEREEPRP
jgi:hypothetical protein